MLRETKRDLAISFVSGCVVEFGIWFLAFIANSDASTAGQFAWLDMLQQPGVKVAYFVAWHIVKPPRYPLSPYLGSAFGFAVLLALWSAVVFATLRTVKFIRKSRLQS